VCDLRCGPLLIHHWRLGVLQMPGCHLFRGWCKRLHKLPGKHVLVNVWSHKLRRLHCRLVRSRHGRDGVHYMPCGNVLHGSRERVHSLPLRPKFDRTWRHSVLSGCMRRGSVQDLYRNVRELHRRLLFSGRGY